MYKRESPTGKYNIIIRICIVFAGLILFVACQRSGIDKRIVVCCEKDNDLYRTMIDNDIACIRYEDELQTISEAKEGSGVMILADRYPEKTTVMDAVLFEKAKAKNLRLYIEYPSFLPGINHKPSRGTHWERAVISSDAFSPDLPEYRIVAIHDCHFIPVEAEDPDIVVARVAGLDSAVYGLPEVTYPILFEVPESEINGELMIATTKLSQFIKARYAPAEAWKTIWEHIFLWLRPNGISTELKWDPVVSPSYKNDAALPADIEKAALRRGIDWYFNSGMIMSPSVVDKYDRPANEPVPGSSDPDIKTDWPFGHRVGFKPDLNIEKGDGSFGVLEGFDAKIFYNGDQPVRWWRRNDCNGEVAGAIGMAGLVLKNEDYLKSSGNIGDWLFFESLMSLGDRSDPDNPAYGLFGWNDIPNYTGPGSADGFGVYYGDDNARGILGMLMVSAALNTDRYNKRIMEALLGNLRLSGIYGFQRNRTDHGPLMKIGWEKLFSDDMISYSPHYQANMWACYIWAWDHTGFYLFLERAKRAVSMTMEAYPDKWEWTNGIQQERAKMLLPLSWLLRIEDTPEHRGWLRIIANDLLQDQDITGAIPEKLGEQGMGGFPPPESNEAYGTSETPLIQSNNDKVSDLLYTTGFAFLGLHEAAAVTGDRFYSDAEDKLAEFLCRIQIRSEKHPELDGGWFRAFDFNRWEYWASNADAGWGAWCIESGWSQSWITSVLALRQMKTSLWEITSDCEMLDNFSDLKSLMIPDQVLAEMPGKD